MKKLIDTGINRQQYEFRLDSSTMATLFNGSSANDRRDLEPMHEPDESFTNASADERPQEFSPGPDPELQELPDALNEQ